MSWGHVYILKKPDDPRLIKIGMTTRTVEKRVKEICAGTGMSDPLEIEFQMSSPDCASAEYQVHQSLADYRHRGDREFFNCSIRVAQNEIISVVSSQLGCCVERVEMPDIFTGWSECEKEVRQHVESMGYQVPDECLTAFVKTQMEVPLRIAEALCRHRHARKDPDHPKWKIASKEKSRAWIRGLNAILESEE